VFSPANTGVAIERVLEPEAIMRYRDVYNPIELRLEQLKIYHSKAEDLPRLYREARPIELKSFRRGARCAKQAAWTAPL